MHSFCMFATPMVIVSSSIQATTIPAIQISSRFPWISTIPNGVPSGDMPHPAVGSRRLHQLQAWTVHLRQRNHLISMSDHSSRSNLGSCFGLIPLAVGLTVFGERPARNQVGGVLLVIVGLLLLAVKAV